MKIIFTSVLFSVVGSMVSASSAWPATDTTGTEIANYTDASGIVYHERLGTFFVVTNAGCVKQISTGGTELSSYCTSSWTDFEGITLADDDNYLYLGLESPQNPQKIYEFDITTNGLTNKIWTLSGMSVATGAGLEALEYVNGYFYAGSQNDGKIYKYSVNLSTSGAATLEASWSPYSSYTKDLAALSYSADTDTLYSLYDGGNRLVTSAGDGTYSNRYQLPTTTINEEGFVVVPNCGNNTTTIVITEDSGRIMKFSGFPIESVQCPAVDADSDGYNETVDCNDADASVHANVTYYRDADGDGLGSAAVTASVCSVSAPTGYVTNSSDSNDSDYDNDGVSSSSDCNDADNSISAYQTYYRDADGDGLGTSSTTSVVCSYTVTTGYVTNASDLNDSDYDNDGVSSGSDCNDADSAVSSNLTVYQDYDGDGLGNPAVSQQVCATTAPTGYVTNNSDTDDSGVVPEPTYSPIEYLSNGIDDDGDGKIDEWNTLESNGVHPEYDSITVTSFAGATNGAIKVRYSDGSGYRYTVFSTTTSRLTKVSWYKTNASILVRLNWKFAVVDAFTGSVLKASAVLRNKK